MVRSPHYAMSGVPPLGTHMDLFHSIYMLRAGGGEVRVRGGVGIGVGAVDTMRKWGAMGRRDAPSDRTTTTMKSSP